MSSRFTANRGAVSGLLFMISREKKVEQTSGSAITQT
jgi:hypothetical protein